MRRVLAEKLQLGSAMQDVDLKFYCLDHPFGGAYSHIRQRNWLPTFAGTLNSCR